MRADCLAALLAPNWQPLDNLAWPSRQQAQWIADELSMTSKLKRYCQHFAVELLSLQQQDKTKLKPDERQLLGDENCLVREVLLHGDGVPWVYARTLIPAASLIDDGAALASLGTAPLGEVVFASKKHGRDALVAALVEVQNQGLFARRSRLWLNDHPMLVAEIFLPNSPVYHKE